MQENKNLVYCFFTEKANPELINLLNELSNSYHFDTYIHKIGDSGNTKTGYSSKLFIFHGDSDEDFKRLQTEFGKFENLMKGFRIFISSNFIDIATKWQGFFGAEFALDMSKLEKTRGELISRLEGIFLTENVKQNISNQKATYSLGKMES